nr:hypothetical protein [Pectinatus frisingensis]
MTAVWLILFTITPTAAIIRVLFTFAARLMGDITSTTNGALNKSGQQKNTTLGSAGTAGLINLQTFLHLFKSFLVNNCGNSIINFNHTGILLPADIFSHTLERVFIPDIGTSIALIFEHIIKRVCTHGFAMPANNAAQVKLIQNIIICEAHSVKFKSLANDSGFRRNNRIAAAF